MMIHMYPTNKPGWTQEMMIHMYPTNKHGVNTGNDPYVSQQ